MKNDEALEDNPLRAIRHLLTAGQGDTLFRDLYLERAAALLAPLLSRDAFAGRRIMKRELERLLRENVAALEQGDWPRVRELTARIKGLQLSVEENAEMTILAQQVYEPAEVVIDPFSPGISGGTGSVVTPDSVTEALEALRREDSANAPFYASRKDRLASLKASQPARGATTPGRRDRSEIQRLAIEAAQAGDVDNLDRLIREMEEPAADAAAVAPGETPSSTPDTNLAAPFPEQGVARAAELGFVAAKADAFPEVSWYLHRWAWQPSFPEPRLTQDGHIRIAGIPDDRGYPDKAPEHLKDTLDLFLIHPYVNSAGLRYLPLLQAETFLVEDFPEEPSAGEGAAILSALGLTRRWGLSRREIERAILRNGPSVLREKFSLDPVEFRLVCIPPDLYCRFGRNFGWGNRQMWTHQDGYQLLKDGGFRALVGGDVRYGGTFDLCSISAADEREGVVARFAVVRRDRLAAS